MRWLRFVLLLPVIGIGSVVFGGEGHDAPAKTILFLCPYGGAKSVIAASYFNRIAQEHDLPYVAVAASAEEPYPAVPKPVAEFLLRDGFDVREFKPRHVEASDVTGASRVVAIDCDLAKAGLADADVERWDDVPKVSDGVEASAAVIRRHVEKLAGELREQR